MLLSEPLASLITFFQDEFNRILLQQSTNVRFFSTHNRIQPIKLKKGSKTYSSGYVLDFLSKVTSWCKHMKSAIYDVMKSYLTRVWDKKILDDYITRETGVVMW